MYESRRNYDTVISGLDRELGRVDYAVKVGKENLEKRRELEKKLRKLNENLEALNILIGTLTSLDRRVKDYASKRKEIALRAVKLALLVPKEIIPDTSQISLDIDDRDKSAYLVDDDGYPIEYIEGTGYSCTTSLFMINTILKQTNHIPDMFLDEMLGALSKTNTTKISDYLNLLADNSVIVIIDQKPEIYKDNDKAIVYIFKKENGVTTIRKR